MVTHPTFRWFLAFLPLVVLFGAVAAMIVDLKHPLVATHETCVIAYVGKLAPNKAVQSYDLLFGDGGQPVHDIRMQCPNNGAVMVNDPDAFQYGIVKEGMQTHVSHITYRWLPEQWRVHIDQTSLHALETAV